MLIFLIHTLWVDGLPSGHNQKGIHGNWKSNKSRTSVNQPIVYVKPNAERKIQ